MPADTSLTDQPSAYHGSATQPYPCSARATPPGAAWAIQYGYCRNSLDALTGSTDPRCPADCQHKAPAGVVARFQKQFEWRGAAAAAAWARTQRKKK